MTGIMRLFGRMCCSNGELLDTVTTRPGSVAAIPDVEVALTAPGPEIVTAMTGPGNGILDLQSKLLRPLELLNLPWQTCASSISYTAHPDGSSSSRNSSSDSNVGAAAQGTHQTYHNGTKQPQQDSQQQQQHSQAQHHQQGQGHQQQHEQQDLQQHLQGELLQLQPQQHGTQQQPMQQQHHKPPLQQHQQFDSQQHQQQLSTQKQQQRQPQQAPILQAACGDAISLYDTDAVTGVRNGDPIADQYGIITYEGGGAVLALADGVNWGHRPMWAAKGAVYGFLSHVHKDLVQKHGGRSISSTDAFQILQAAVQAAQHHVTAADGTLTTLVAAVVCRQRRSKQYRVLSVTVGDSDAFVWRAAAAKVEDLTYTAPRHGFHRDPRLCPGCLGYAIGDAPDLSNITYSIAAAEQGDIIFLTSDGVSDNFDPVTRKQASPRTIGEGSNRQPGVAALSPATCHAMATAEMAALLRDSCRQRQQQQGPSKRKSQRDEALDAVDVSLQAAEHSSKQGPQPTPQVAPAAALNPVNGHNLSAEGVLNTLLAFAWQATQQQRQVLEDPATRQSLKDDQIADLVASLPGKIDHASVVAFRVGG